MIAKNRKTETSPMLSPDDIGKLHGKLNLKSVEKGLEQAEQRLNYELDIEDSLNKKALDLLKLIFTLLSIFIASMLASIKFSQSLFTNGLVNIELIVFDLLLLASLFLFFISLHSRNYGALGRYPDTWLQRQIIDGNDDSHTTTLAYILYDYQARIEVSVANNYKKATYLNFGVWFIAFNLSQAAIAIFVLIYQT